MIMVDNQLKSIPVFSGLGGAIMMLIILILLQFDGTSILFSHI